MPLTSQQKTASRRAALNAAAQAAGWSGIDDLLSAVRAGKVRLPRKPESWTSRPRRASQKP